MFLHKLECLFLNLKVLGPPECQKSWSGQTNYNDHFRRRTLVKEGVEGQSTRADLQEKEKKKFLASYWFAEYGTSEGPE